MNINRATQIAINEAEKSSCKHKIGCIIYDNSNYVTGYNYTHGVEVPSKRNRWSIHAEEHTIIKAARSNIDLQNSTMVVVRINNKGSLRLAKPCKTCANLIRQMKIPKILYSNDPFNRIQINENFKSL